MANPVLPRLDLFDENVHLEAVRDELSRHPARIWEKGYVGDYGGDLTVFEFASFKGKYAYVEILLDTSEMVRRHMKHRNLTFHMFCFLNRINKQEIKPFTLPVGEVTSQ